MQQEERGTYVCLILRLRVWLVSLNHVDLGHVGHVGLGFRLRLVVGALAVVLVGLGFVVRLACGLVFLLIMVPGRIGEGCTSDKGGRSQEGNDGGLEEHLDLK